MAVQFGDVGNALVSGTHAGYYGQKAALEADEAQREQAAAPDVLPAVQGDKGAMARVIANDPKRAALIGQAVQRADANQRAKMKEGAEFATRSANAVLQADPKDQPAMYQRMLEQGRAEGHDVSNLPQTWDNSVPGILRYHRGLGIDVNKELDRQTRLFIHNNPTSVGGGPAGIEPLPGAPVPAPAPQAAPAGPPRVSEAPGAAVPSQAPTSTAAVAPPQPAMQTAQAAPGTATGQVTAAPDIHAQSPGPLKPEGIGVGAPPVGGGVPPLPTDADIVFFNPTEQGGKLRHFVPNPQKGLPRRPAIHENGYAQYTMPNGVDVYWKPEKPQNQERALPPQGYEHDPVAPGRLRAIPGGPADAAQNNQGGLTGEEFIATLPPDRAAQLKALQTGRLTLSPRVQASKEGKQLMSDLMSAYPDDYDSIVSGQRQKTANEFAVGTAAKNVTSLNTAIQHLGEVHRLASDLHNFETPLMNTVTNFAQKQSGDRRITDFETAKHAVVEEISKVFRGMGQSDAEIKAWEDKISSSQSPAQLQGQIETITHLLNGRIEALGEQYKTGMGRSVPPLQILTPQSQATLEYVNKNKIAGRAGSESTPQEPQSGPKPGTVEQGYRFKGGNPADKSNWEKAQ